MDNAHTPRATVGIICEFNPFHNGHAYLLKRARELGDCVVCIMSGRTVQRGTVAVADPYVRAEMALEGGADLVLELPFPWCSGSAAYFAAAGVHVLTSLGIDHLLFGSECGSLEPLREAASVVRSRPFVEQYTALCQSGMGTAAAYREALAGLCPGLALGANDLLGIAYLDAIVAQNSPLIPHTVRRMGDGYHETALHNQTYPSATALRSSLGSANADEILATAMPPACLSVWREATGRGDAPIDGRRLLDVAHAAFRMADATQIAACAELGGGLGDRMIRQAHATTDGATFFESLRTRLYPDARLHRGILFALTQALPQDLDTLPTYTTVLAANPIGCAHLAALRKSDSALTIVTKAADAPYGRQKELSDRVDALVSLCLPTPRPTGWLLQKSPCIQKE